MSADLLYNEKELIEQLVNSNEKAFDQIYASFADRLYGVAFAYTKSAHFAEDIVQEVFIKLWEKREGLGHIESIERYIFTMTRNAVINRLRDLARERDRYKKLAEFFTSNTITPEQELTFKESTQLIEQAVSKLSFHQQRVYRLSREQGLSRQEIAKQLDISENTVRNHIANASQFIREYIQQHSASIICLLALLLLEL